MKGLERLIKDAIEAVADQLLSGNAPIQKPYDVTWGRHTPAAIPEINKGGPNMVDDELAALAGLGALWHPAEQQFQPRGWNYTVCLYRPRQELVDGS
jgi:hypothetical protein